MAKCRDLNEPAFEEWLATRPREIQDLAHRFPPDRLYSLAPNGTRVIIYAYSEDETLIVDVLASFNALTFERRVFGIKPTDLTECDLPDPDETLGALLTDRGEIEAAIDMMREATQQERN